MSVLYQSSPSDFESQYGSPHGFHDMSAGHSSDEIVDRSKPSTSPFFPKIEYSPGGYPMSFNMSGSSFSDPENIDWNSLDLGDGISTTSPMSNEPYEQDQMMLYNNPVSQAMHAINITASQRQPHTESFSYDFAPQQFPSRQFYETHRSDPSISGSGIPSNHGWYQESLDHPDIKIDNSMSDHDQPFSASSISTQASLHGPWSAVNQSRVSVNAAHMNFNATSAGQLQNDHYAASSYDGLSIDSSPLAQGIRTPSSTRSPLFGQAQLSGSVGSCNSRIHVHDHQHETPRALQTGFLPTRETELNFMGLNPQLHGPKHRQRRRQVQREPTHSPVSDYVMVEPENGSTRTSSYSGSTKAEPSASAPRSPTIFVPEQYPPSAESAKQQSSHYVIRKTRDGKRAGGRSLGMHLPADKAARAKLLREEGSCWICCLQRDSCTPGITCERCIKRNQRATMENGLGCDRTKLTDLKSYFLPDFLLRMGDKQELSGFVEQHIGRWRNSAFRFKLNMIWGIPPMEFELYEFEPKTNELLRQMQYVLDESTGTRDWIEKRSPPLAMVHIENEDRDRYEQYLNQVVDKYLDKFVDRCYKYEKDDFQGRLFKLMTQLKPETKEQTALIRDIFRLQIVTYIYARGATIPPKQIKQLYTLHHSAKNPNVRYGKATSPRMANRQLKVLYCSLFSQIMDSVLRRLQQVLRSSRGGAKWTSAFIALLGLAMCFEEVQRTSHANQDADALMGQLNQWEATQSAEAACRIIDDKFQFMANLFRWKYHRGFNPLRDFDEPKVRENLSESSLAFVRGVAALVQEKNDFLFAQQHVPILKANQDKYTSRLVARFLLAFWGPTPN